MAMHLLDFVLMVIAAIGPVYVAYKVRKRSEKLYALAILLASFTLAHSAYHLLEYVGWSFLAEVLFWPLGAMLLLAFGIFYWKAGV
jgi:hypothetical protein